MTGAQSTDTVYQDNSALGGTVGCERLAHHVARQTLAPTPISQMRPSSVCSSSLFIYYVIKNSYRKCDS